MSKIFDDNIYIIESWEVRKKMKVKVKKGKKAGGEERIRIEEERERVRQEIYQIYVQRRK